jgi:5-formyltetrahydrofolate cyclo-ligase
LLKDATTVMLYYPLSDEVDIRVLIDELVGQGRTVLLPRVTGDTTMELRRYSGEADLCEGAFGIMEPVGEVFTDYDNIDVAVIPAMAYDADGHRLGRGRGYYDRFLAAVPSIYKIGVCFDFQRVPEVPVDTFDVSVDIVV